MGAGSVGTCVWRDGGGGCIAVHLNTVIRLRIMVDLQYVPTL